MRLEGQAHLENTVPKQNQAHGANQGKYEIGQVADYVQGIACAGSGGEGRSNGRGQGKGQADAQ